MSQRLYFLNLDEQRRSKSASFRSNISTVQRTEQRPETIKRTFSGNAVNIVAAVDVLLRCNVLFCTKMSI